jgi:hypothetical protein
VPASELTLGQRKEWSWRNRSCKGKGIIRWNSQQIPHNSSAFHSQNVTFIPSLLKLSTQSTERDFSELKKWENIYSLSKNFPYNQLCRGHISHKGGDLGIYFVFQVPNGSPKNTKV